MRQGEGRGVGIDITHLVIKGFQGRGREEQNMEFFVLIYLRTSLGVNISNIFPSKIRNIIFSFFLNIRRCITKCYIPLMTYL